ncbi:MAG: L,D-transpeptidase [Thermodesulfobacteriota bacterium]
MSVIRPGDTPESQDKRTGIVETLLAVPFDRLKIDKNYWPRVLASHAMTTRPGGGGDDQAAREQQLAVPNLPLPGRGGGLLPQRWTRTASLGPTVVAPGPRLSLLLANGPAMTKIGRLAKDPSGLYSSLEIHVYKRDYRLQLIGLRGTKQDVLFETRVGLGSGEYPTPNGRYFITMIYDDHPWWIPPDREWAWGQSPSRTVYGGHMMPLMSKREMRGSGAEDEDFDAVAPKVQIIDSGGYRVHGTDSPWSVGGNQSHGCIRMKNATVEELANKLKMYVGITGRSQSANGTYVTLARPVRITLTDKRFDAGGGD